METISITTTLWGVWLETSTSLCYVGRINITGDGPVRHCGSEGEMAELGRSAWTPSFAVEQDGSGWKMPSICTQQNLDLILYVAPGKSQPRGPHLSHLPNEHYFCRIQQIWYCQTFTVSAYSGGDNETAQNRRLQQQKLISHSSGSWKSKVGGPAWSPSGEGPLPGSELVPSGCVCTRRKEPGLSLEPPL